jgi:hypothetical protein
VVVAAHGRGPPVSQPVSAVRAQRRGEFRIHQRGTRSGQRRQPRGQVDHRPVHVAEPGQHPARGHADAQRGQALAVTVRAGEPERDRGRVGRPVCDEQHLVADHLDHVAVVAHHGLGGVLLEGFQQGGGAEPTTVNASSPSTSSAIATSRADARSYARTMTSLAVVSRAISAARSTAR